jgi:hypothetical protein
LEGSSVTSSHKITAKFTNSGQKSATVYSVTADSSGNIVHTIDGSALIANLAEGTSPAYHTDYIVAQYATGGTTNTGYYRRKLSMSK